MIRIDEIYEHTFLPWVNQNLPNTSISYCDPFGYSNPESILHIGPKTPSKENASIFFFDQEPIQPSIHLPTFDCFSMCNRLMTKKLIVTSETNSDNLDYICKVYGLQPFYYFFHGWAALDWYRGYDRTFLITPLDQRKIRKTFFSPNRIIGGERKHRVYLLYLMKKYKIMDNNISFPAVCPAENQSVKDIAEYFKHIWPSDNDGIVSMMSQIDLPLLFPKEDTQRMSSCWLDQFELVNESLIYHVSETVYFGRRLHLTEKTFKPIAMGMPFLLSAPAHSLEYLMSYGFKTFSSIWDESYDQEEDDINRANMSMKVLREINQLPTSEKQQIFEKCIPIIKHNWDHFYNGGFEKVLWAELTTMLYNIKAVIQGDLSSN